MAHKNIILRREKTRILYNKARSKILQDNPKISRLTDDIAMEIILNEYIKEAR